MLLRVAEWFKAPVLKTEVQAIVKGQFPSRPFVCLVVLRGMAELVDALDLGSNEFKLV